MFMRFFLVDSLLIMKIVTHKSLRFLRRFWMVCRFCECNYGILWCSADNDEAFCKESEMRKLEEFVCW